jgi:hypothetical protein
MSRINVVYNSQGNENIRSPNKIHCYDALTHYICPFRLWLDRRGYKRKKYSSEDYTFFAAKRIWHRKLQEIVVSCFPHIGEIEHTIEHESKIGNIDIIKFDPDGSIHIYECKSYFHLNTKSPYHLALVQILLYGYLIRLYYDNPIICHVVYLNKAFEFEYPEIFTPIAKMLFKYAKCSIEAYLTPARVPLNGKCNQCNYKQTHCANRRRGTRYYFEIPGG